MTIQKSSDLNTYMLHTYVLLQLFMSLNCRRNLWVYLFIRSNGATSNLPFVYSEHCSFCAFKYIRWQMRRATWHLFNILLLVPNFGALLCLLRINNWKLRNSLTLLIMTYRIHNVHEQWSNDMYNLSQKFSFQIALVVWWIDNYVGYFLFKLFFSWSHCLCFVMSYITTEN